MKLYKINKYEFYIDSVQFNIEQHDTIYYTYINNKWTEHKCFSLKEAVDILLQETGITKNKRKNIINNLINNIC